MIQNDLVNLIRQIIIEEENKKMKDNKVGKWWVGEVDTVNGTNNTATILLPNQTIPTQHIPNKTNQSLVSGDTVYLFSPYGSLGSAWIDVAFKKYV